MDNSRVSAAHSVKASHARPTLGGHDERTWKPEQSGGAQLPLPPLEARVAVAHGEAECCGVSLCRKASGAG